MAYFRERRRHIRVGVSLAFNYTPIHNPGEKNKSFTKNISGGGMRIPLKEEFQTGTILKLELQLLKERKKLSLEARVAWIKPSINDDEYPFEAGIEFINIDVLKKTMISNYIQYLNREELLKEGAC